MSRVQLIRAASVLGAAVVAITFTAVSKGSQFGVTVELTTGGPTPVTVQVADDSGKIRVFKAVDDFIAAAAKYSIISSASAVGMSFSNLLALEPPVFTGDIVKRTRATIASYSKNVVALTAVSADLSASIALLPAVTPGEIAYKAEKILQRATIEANKTWLSAEVTRITALLPV